MTGVELPPELAQAARPAVNTLGAWTRVGNSRVDDDVLSAMAWAGRHYLVIDELQRAASAIISRCTGAAAGCATNGAAGGLLGAVAACRAGLDPDRMLELPDAPDGRDVILFASQRSAYEPCLRAGGARLVVVDDALASLRDRLRPDVAAVFYDAQPAKLGAAPDLADVVRAAHAHGVPVIVDASLALPPRENLTGLVASGADLVAFSGSKTIGGPGASGFLAGRVDLVQSALAQQSDGDIRERLGLDRRPGPVQMGIGRVTKTGKEEIVGLLFALDRYAALEPPPSGCDPQLVLAALDAIDGVDARLEQLADGVVVKVTVDGVPAREARDGLLAGDPPVAVLLVGDELMLRATSLRADEVAPLAAAFTLLRERR